jgi:hypothetical protein
VEHCCAGGHTGHTPFATQACPQCGVACKPVEMRTIYHHTKFPDNTAIITDHYYFCPTKSCSIGYFSTSGNCILKPQLRTYSDIQQDQLCYCFDIHLADLNANQADAIKNFVIQQTREHVCACDIKNPSGQCCLALLSQHTR